MAIDIKTTETIRINKNVITVRVVVATGKEGDFLLHYRLLLMLVVMAK